MFLFILWQCTWGVLQTLAGAAALLFNIRRPHYFYRGALVTEWRLRGSVSLGMLVFLSESGSEKARRKVLTHEYGHCIQSLILGPLYLLVIGLPSVIWAGAFGGFRARRRVSYYSLYTERWANFLGARITGEDIPQ